MIAELYAMIPRHGAALLFAAALLSCAGVPIPTSALLLAAGAFIAAGDMTAPPVIAAALAGALIGDQAGYWAGRLGGQGLRRRLLRHPRVAPLMQRAEAELHKHTTVAVLVSRWPLSALGPWVNLASGAANVAWPRFSLCVVAGDIAWVAIHLGLGYVFAARVKDLGATMGSVVVAVSAAAAAAGLAWLLWDERAAIRKAIEN